MKNTYKMLLVGAMAAIMSMSVFGCDGKNKQTVDNTENGSSLDYLGEYSEEDGEDYLTASAFPKTEYTEDEPQGDAANYDKLEKATTLPDFPSGMSIDKSSTTYGSGNNSETYTFKFTYNGYSYKMTFKWDGSADNSTVSEVKKDALFIDANGKAMCEYKYRVGQWTTVAADIDSSDQDITSFVKDMYNSVINKISTACQGQIVPDLPSGAVLDESSVKYELGALVYNTYYFEFTYGGKRYSVDIRKTSGSNSDDIEYVYVSPTYDGEKYIYQATYRVMQWRTYVNEVNSNASEEELGNIATALFNSAKTKLGK